MTDSKPTPRAPAHLSKRARKLWRDILAAYDFDAAELVLLRAGLEHLDLHDVSMAHVREHGPVLQTDGGMARANPATRTAKDALTASRLALKQLGIAQYVEGN